MISLLSQMLAQMLARLVAPTFILFLIMNVNHGAFAAPISYPTETLADYIFGCMNSTGQTPDTLRRCSCSIDYIASKLDYDDYVHAETVLRMQQVSGGDRSSMFKTSSWALQMIDKLRETQAEAEAKCFSP